MYPPLNLGGLADDTAPLTSWHNEMSFDSARDCEEGKATVLDNRIEGFRKLEKIQIPYVPRAMDQEIRWTRSEFALSKCIGTDDPRLKEKVE